MSIINNFVPAHISTNTTTQVKTGTGTLHSIVINATAAGTITIYDETGSNTTNVIGIIKASAAEGTYLYDCNFTRGLKIITAASSDITVNYY